MKIECFTKHPQTKKVIQSLFPGILWIHENYSKLKVQVQVNVSIKPRISKLSCKISSPTHCVSWTVLSEDPWAPFIRQNYTVIPLSFCVKGQDKSLRNSTKYATVPTHSFNLWIDRPLRTMLCYAATANQRVS